MMSPQERANEKIRETELVIKDVKDILNKLELPDFAKDIQLTSLNKRLNNLKEEYEEIERTSDSEELILTLHPKNFTNWTNICPLFNKYFRWFSKSFR